MKNFSVKINDKLYWISRSVAVAGFIFNKINGKLHILAAKRGSGAADNIGLWNCPCGYLDYDETTVQACNREIFEETGITLLKTDFKLFDINEDLEGRQNITFKYYAILDRPWLDGLFDLSNCEQDEVEEVKFIPIEDISKFEWAFNHDEIINFLINTKIKCYD